MRNHKATVIGVLEDRTQAEQAVNDLRRAGFRDDQIGILTHDTERPTAVRPHLKPDATRTRWENGAGLGAAVGAVTGTGLGLAVAAGLMTGVGPVIAGGTLMALLASAGAGAAVGTVLGALMGLGVPEEDARFYEKEFESGRTIVTVQADDRSELAWDTLARHGAYDHAAVEAGTGLPATPY